MNRTSDDQQQQQHSPQRVASDERKAARRAERARAEASEPREHGGIEIGRLREVGRNLGSQIEDQTKQRPYVVLGAAVGLGFLAGSVFGSRLGQVILAAGIGYAAKNLLADFGVERLEEGIEKLTQERVKG